MTIVRIGERDYPWPEGCKYFERRGDQFIFWYQKGARGFICSNPNGEMCPMGAAVAARHFRNKADREYRLYHECVVISWHDKAGMDIKEKHLQTAEDAVDAAKAWETLCNDL